jgi:predicted RNase H-like nuclease
LGVDARGRGAFTGVEIGEHGYRRAVELDRVEATFEHGVDAAAIAFDVPIGHDDPNGERGGERACEQAMRELLGEAAFEERVLAYPPPVVFEEASTFPSARDRCEAEGWPRLAKPIFFARERLEALERRAVNDSRVVEVHPELSFAVLNRQQGGSGPLEHYGEGWAAANERLELFQAAGLSPETTLDEANAHPRSVLDAAIAAWTARRVAQGEARVFPEQPPSDPRTGREVALHA